MLQCKIYFNSSKLFRINNNKFKYLFRIESKTFIDSRNQTVALFPTEDPNCINVSCSEGKENESFGTRGCPYNY